jgi:acyl transferase domain-containing protein
MSLHTPPAAPICQQARHEPNALIGIGCRFPGGATDPASFWKLLCDGVDAIGEIPRDRWDIKAFYDPELGRPGKSCSRRGGFLDGVDTFDPQAFGISPREAACMDPQQRLLLEAAWEALEDGSQTLAGTNAGVFIGLSSADYLQLQTNLCDRSGVDMYSSMGSAMSIATNESPIAEPSGGRASPWTPPARLRSWPCISRAEAFGAASVTWRSLVART